MDNYLDSQRLKNAFEELSIQLPNDLDIRFNILKQIYTSMKNEAETL